MQKIPSSSSSHLPAHADEPQQCQQPAVTEVILQGTKLCAAFAQTTAAVEGGKPDAIAPSFQTCDRLIQKSTSLPTLLLGPLAASPLKDNEDFTRLSGKVDRGLERLRRACHKLADGRDSPPELVKAASGLLKSCVEALRQTLSLTVRILLYPSERI